MTNMDVRTLKIFEFNRALSYVSNILEMEEKQEKLTKEKQNNGIELENWIHELTAKSVSYTDEEIIMINEFREALCKRNSEIDKEQEKIRIYVSELKDLVTKVMEFVFSKDMALHLTETEIKSEMVDEYTYILGECKPNGKEITLEDLFEYDHEEETPIFIAYLSYHQVQRKMLLQASSEEEEKRIKIGSFAELF